MDGAGRRKSEKRRPLGTTGKRRESERTTDGGRGGNELGMRQ